MRNRPDRIVEAVFEGEAGDVDRLVDWTRHGPELAIVDEVRVYDETPEGLSGFAIRQTVADVVALARRSVQMPAEPGDALLVAAAAS